MNLFVENIIKEDWNGELHLSTIPCKVDWRRTLNDLPCGDGFIESGFEFNGASVGLMRSFLFLGFPKWKHPIATCRHDMRCNYAHMFKKTQPKLYKSFRKFADQEFKKDVAKGGTWWEQQKGYVGIRIGAFF